MKRNFSTTPGGTNEIPKLALQVNIKDVNLKNGQKEEIEEVKKVEAQVSIGVNKKTEVGVEEKVEHNVLDNIDYIDNWKDYCPFVLPQNRGITPVDDLISTQKNLNDFRNEVLTNLGIETLTYDLSKIEERKNLLNNYNTHAKEKWYLFFQPLNNVSIEHYWKYEKVTLTDIMNSNIDTSKNMELKKNKKSLKHVAKYILAGKPHESLVKNGYKVYAHFLNSASKYYVNPLNTASASLLSLKNSKCINDSDKLLNWKLKFTNNLSILQNIKAQRQTQRQTQRQAPTSVPTPTPTPTLTPTSVQPPTRTQTRTQTRIQTRTPTPASTPTPIPTTRQAQAQLQTHMSTPTQISTQRKINSSAVNTNEVQERNKAMYFNQRHIDTRSNKHSNTKVIKDNTKRGRRKHK